MSGDVLIVDDEPEYLEWLFDYFEAKGYKVHVKTNLSDGLDMIDCGIKFKLLIIDMNIPSPGSSAELLVNATTQKYPGFFLIHQFRNKGYNERQIIAYTVHDDDIIDVELQQKIGCRYVLKGRPQILKGVIEKSL